MTQEGPVTDWFRDRFEALVALILAIKVAVEGFVVNVEHRVADGINRAVAEVHDLKVWFVCFCVGMAGLYLIGQWLQGRNRGR